MTGRQPILHRRSSGPLRRYTRLKGGSMRQNFSRNQTFDTDVHVSSALVSACLDALLNGRSPHGLVTVAATFPGRRARIPCQ